MSNFDLQTMGFPIHGLQFPFSGLSMEDTIDQPVLGTYGVIFKISRHVVYKAPILHSMAPSVAFRAQQAIDSHKAQKRECRAYQFLDKHPHPNILQCLITVPQGLFLERMAMSLWHRVTKFAEHPVTLELKLRWAGEIAAAAAWLEKLGQVHGEIRPTNVLLSDEQHIKLAGFDNSVKVNTKLPNLKVPYWIKRDDMELAGASSEQFGYASTLFFIEKGTDAVFELSDVGVFVSFTDFAPNAFPFAGVVRKAWEGGFADMAEVERTVSAESVIRRVKTLDVCRLVRMLHARVEYYTDPNKGIMPREVVHDLVEFCQEWMKIHKKDHEAEARERLRRRVSAQEMKASF